MVVKTEYIISAIFFLLSLISLWIRKPMRKKLHAIFYRDQHISKIEEIIMKLSAILTYILSIFFLHIAVRQLSAMEKYIKTVDTVFFSFYVASGTVAIMKIIDISIEKLRENASKKVPESEIPLIETYFSMISKIVKVFTIIIAGIAILDRFGFNVASIIASLGVGSLAVGLAAKDTIKNFISGIILVTDRQFRIGDRIVLKDLGVEGFVHDIGLRTTRIVTITGNNLIIIPNSKITEGIIENMLYPKPEVKDFIEVGVSYGSDVSKVKELILKAIKEFESEGVLSQPSPSIFFTQFGDSALMFKAIYYVKEKSVAFGLKSKIHERILELFRENSIEIPFPCRTNYFPEGIKVKIEKD